MTRISEKDLTRKCETISRMMGKPVKWWAECGIWFVAVRTEQGNAIAYQLTSRGTKKEVYSELCAIENALNYIANNGLAVRR